MRDKEVLKHFYRSFVVYVKSIYSLIDKKDTLAVLHSSIYRNF